MNAFAPAPKTKLLRPATWKRILTPRRRYLGICAIIKNEQRWIAEWIAFHRVLGVESFILYDNGSTDRTLEIIRSLPDQGRIKIIPWPYIPGQFSAYQHAIENHSHESEWLAFIDVDEFCTPVGVDDSRIVLERYEKYSALLVHWLMFGSNGLDETSSDLCIEMFTRRAPLDFFANRHVKTIARTRNLRQIGLDPHVFSVDGLMATENFAEYSGMIGGYLDSIPVADTLRLHHYFVKSRQSWIAKVERGRADMTVKRDLAEFDAYDRNDVEDLEAARFAPALRKYLGMDESVKGYEARG